MSKISPLKPHLTTLLLIRFVAGVESALQRLKTKPGILLGPRIFAPPPPLPLYLGDSVKELLALNASGCVHTDLCNSYDPNSVQVPHPPELEELSLELPQESVRDFVKHIGTINTWEVLLLYTWTIVAFLMGCYLLFRKHFRFDAVFYKDVPDPTYGMPLWQFLRMKYNAVVVEDKRDSDVRKEEEFQEMENIKMEEKALGDLHKRTRIVPGSLSQGRIEAEEAKAGILAKTQTQARGIRGTPQPLPGRERRDSDWEETQKKKIIFRSVTQVNIPRIRDGHNAARKRGGVKFSSSNKEL